MAERTYYRTGYPTVCYEKWLFSEKKLDAFYFYEETGKYYEFFSGIYLGQKGEVRNVFASCSYTEYAVIIEESTLTLNLSVVSAENFVKDVRPYMKHKEKIAIAVKNLLEEKHREWLKVEAERQKKNLEENRKKAEDVSWLNDILDARK